MKQAKQKLTEIEKAYKVYNDYKDGKWILISVLQSILSLLVALVIFTLKDEMDFIKNISKLEWLGIFFLTICAFLIFNGVRLLLAKTNYQRLKIEQVEGKTEE